MEVGALKNIEKVAVIGAGNMGHQISLNAAMGGFEVVVNDVNKEALKKAQEFVETYCAKQMSKQKMTKEEADGIKGRMLFSDNLKEAVKDADLVIECIVELLDVKRNIFKEMETYCKSDTVLATNSSTFASSLIAEVLEKPERCCNLHYFNPALVMKLVEIVKGPHTSQCTIDRVVEFAKKIGKKTCVLQKEVENFVVNRFITRIYNEALWLRDMGIASMEEIDDALVYGLGHPMGPFKLMDLTGIDLYYTIEMGKYIRDGVNPPSPALVAKYTEGAFGRKTGRGWYEYKEK